MKAQYKALGGYGTLGIEIALSVILPAWGGHWLDNRWGTAPWLMVVCFGFGCGAAGKAIHRTYKEMQRDTAREEREQGNPSPMFEKPGDRKQDAEGGHDDERT